MAITTLEKVEELYSTRAMDSVTDDLTSGERDTMFAGIVEDVEGTFTLYIGSMYAIEDLRNSTWAKSRADWMAAHLLSVRRGNEHYFFELYEQAVNELIAIMEGAIPPLADIPLREDLTPAMSNLMIDYTIPNQQIRVTPNNSVGRTYPAQATAISFWDWL